MAFLDETGLAELWSLIQAKDEEIAGSAAKIATGSYTGNGTYASSNPCSLTFDFVPMIVIIFKPSGGSITEALSSSYKETYWSHNFGILTNGLTTTYVSPGMWGGSLAKAIITITWSDKTVSWYSNSYGSVAGDAQWNTASTTYQYIAIGQ